MVQDNGKTIFGMSVDLASGAWLLLATLAALVVVNTGGAGWYEHVLHIKATLGVAPLSITKTLHHWISDGLMVLFFVLVGIEINRELRMGSLKKPSQAAMPALAALGGFLIPAGVYLTFINGNDVARAGWSIPTATDIAFAVAMVTVLRNYVPPAMRIFLLALAVVDDLLAIFVIALFYTANVLWMNLFLALMGVGVLLLKNQLKIRALWVYVAVGIFMWLCVLTSGVHATVAGVMLGVLLPLRNPIKGKPSPAEQVEHALLPWVRWLIVPLFAFANVGVDLSGVSLETLMTPITLGIIAALLVGKQLGVFGTVWLIESLKWAKRPAGATWVHVYGIACLCGIGFTMSLFIGGLAFPPELQPQVRMGVLVGSTLSALIGLVVLVGFGKVVAKPPEVSPASRRVGPRPPKPPLSKRV